MAKRAATGFQPAEFLDEVGSVLAGEDVGYVATEFLRYEGKPFYPAGALVEARVAKVWLGEGKGGGSETIDLIFRMPPFEDQASGFNLYEIVLRTGAGAVYGGWAFGGELYVGDRIVAGHRVIETAFRDESLRFSYEPSCGRYRFTGGELKGLSTASIRAMAKSRQRF